MAPAPVVQQSVLLELPRDMVVDVFSFLTADDVARVSRTCGNMNKYAQDNWMWRNFAQRISPFCNVEKYNRNWKACYVGLRRRNVGWNGGKAGDFEVITMRGHSDYVQCFLVYNNRIITGSADATLKIWPTHKTEVLSTFTGHTRSIRSLQSDGIRAFSGSADGSARLWDISATLNTAQFDHGGSVEAVLLDENQVCTAGSNSQLKIWDIRSNAAVEALGHMGPIQHIKKDDSGRIVTCSYDAIKVWDLRAAAPTGIFLGPAPVRNPNVYTAAGANCIQISNNKIVAGGLDGRVHVYDPATNTDQTFNNQHHQKINCLQCDGSKIVTGSSDSTLKVWDIPNNTLLRTLEDHKGPIHGLQFDNSKIVSCSADNTVKVWKLNTGQRLYTLLGGSLQARANNPPHPERPGCSGVVYDESSIFASFNALVRNYCFEPTPPQQE